MKHFILKGLPIFLIYIFLFGKQSNCQCGETIQSFVPNLTESRINVEHYLTPQIIFDQKSGIKTGELMECEITNTKKMESSKADVHVFTQYGTDKSDYIFYPASKDKKCFSYQVRTTVFPCILLSAGHTVVDRLEVILAYHGKSVIRTKDMKHVDSKPTPGIVNANEFRGFWIRWLDDQLIEVGRDTENVPLLSYRLPEKLSINFIGILSYTAVAEWIIHTDPKCGTYNVTETQTVAETKCKLVAYGNVHTNNIVENLHEKNILEKSQLSILYQMKNQYENFKKTKFRSKEILLEYQRLIKKYFKNAEENYNKIYAGDNEIFCPLKAKTYNEIANEYFQFLEELQMELSVFKDLTTKSSDNLITHCNVCIGCMAAEN